MDNGPNNIPPKISDSGDPKPSGLAAFWAELKRRKVVRVAMVYAVVGWLVIQVANATFSQFGIPVWAYRFVVLMVALGFPISVVLAWAFELTPDGIKTTQHAREEQGNKPLSESQQKKRNWMAFTFAAAVPTLIFGILAVFFYLRSDPSSLVSSPSSLIIDKSIAVLPFTNMSPDAENAYFADGMHETILTTLANLGSLRVTSRTSVMPYRDSDIPIPAIGQELNVAYILEGSVQRIGNQFRLTTQLINAGTDEHLWAKNYDGEFKEVFAVQSRLAREISESLEAVLSPEENERLERKPTENLEAYDLYLKVVSLGDRWEEKLEPLEQAVSLDPDFALAWAALSRSYITRFFLGDDRTEAAFRKAKAAMLTALRLDPRNPDVVFTTGLYFSSTFQFSLADYFLQMAMEQVPNDAYILRLIALNSFRKNKWKEGMEYLETADRLEANSVNFFLFLGYSFSHDWKKATYYSIKRKDPDSIAYLVGQIMGEFMQEGRIAKYDELDALDAKSKTHLAYVFGDAANVLKYASVEDQSNVKASNSSLFHLVSRSPSWMYAIAQLVDGNTDEARRTLVAARERLLARYESNYEDFYSLEQLGLVHALLGDETSSLESFDQAFAFRNQEEESSLNVEFFIDRAIALAWLGRKDEAVAELARLIKIPSKLNPHFMRHCLDFWPLRDHPGFQAIIDDPANSQPLDLDKL